jgi:hypothetical protein
VAAALVGGGEATELAAALVGGGEAAELAAARGSASDLHGPCPNAGSAHCPAESDDLGQHIAHGLNMASRLE